MGWNFSHSRHFLWPANSNAEQTKTENTVCFILFTQYYFYNITLFYKHIYVRLAVELTRRLLFNRKTLKVSVLSNLRYVFYNILIYSDIYMLCMLNGPKLFSQTAFPLVLTERRLIVRFSLIYICILLRYIIL